MFFPSIISCANLDWYAIMKNTHYLAMMAAKTSPSMGKESFDSLMTLNLVKSIFVIYTLQLNNASKRYKNTIKTTGGFFRCYSGGGRMNF